jgi:hypothetical protein
VPDDVDNCPSVSNPDQSNHDGDSFGDACDNDDDNDGIPNGSDNCPDVYNPAQEDADMDGIGNACETPDVGVEAEGGLLYANDLDGLLMRGLDGNCYLLYVNAEGRLVVAQRECPD